MTSWQALTFIAIAGVVAVGFAWYERSRPGARVVALVAALAALAVAGRLLIHPFPNVVATTDIAFLTGFALGGPAGFAVGALAAPISNIWLGQGPWTVWQMAGWGAAGLAGAVLARLTGRRCGRLGLALACAATGLAYGALLDLSVMVTYGGEQSVDRYLVLAGRGIPFNVAHAAGNFVLALAAGPALVRIISRYRERLSFRWLPAGAGAPVILVVAALMLVGSAPSGANASGGAGQAADWLASQRSADGGFAAYPGGSVSPSMTGWAMLGLEAADRNPLDLGPRRKTPVAYLRASSERINSTGDLERTILALRGAGLNPRKWAGRNLVAELIGERGGDGGFHDQVNLTAFGVLALDSAKVRSTSSSRRWLRRAQNGDGGWGFKADAPSDADSTGAVLQALGVGAGKSRGKAVADGAAYLRRAQQGDGSWTLSGGAPNSQSTAWAVQGLVATGKSKSVIADGIDYLDSLQAADGHYRYSKSSDQSSIWVTAQVIAARRRSELPLDPVARARKPAPTVVAGRRAGGPAGPGAVAASASQPNVPAGDSPVGGAGPVAGSAGPGRESQSGALAPVAAPAVGESPPDDVHERVAAGAATPSSSSPGAQSASRFDWSIAVAATALGLLAAAWAWHRRRGVPGV